MSFPSRTLETRIHCWRTEEVASPETSLFNGEELLLFLLRFLLLLLFVFKCSTLALRRGISLKRSTVV